MDALHVLALILAVGGGWAGARGTTMLVQGIRHPDHVSAPLRIVRGIRGVVVAVGAEALAGGMLFGHTWLIVFGAIEELYETSVLALILRAAGRLDPTPSPARWTASQPATEPSRS